MSVNDWLELGTDCLEDFLKNHRFLKSLGKDFVPKSRATRGIPIEPEVPVGKVLEELDGYDRFWSGWAGRREELILKRDGHLLMVEARRGFVSLVVFSEKADAREIVGGLIEKLEKYRFKNEEEDGVWADFSYLGSQGPVRTTNFLRCPTWEQVKRNYPDGIQTDLEWLMGAKEPWKYGRLIIWHGVPGTGKTFCIRAMMQAWKEQFNFLVITDPEHFAKEPGYYFNVATESSEMPRGYRGDEEEPLGSWAARRKKKENAKRTLFILEDSADLIMPESRERHYDKIGKLLNMTDGLFGQGREDLFLITFNEKVERIDPAFVRPGRCVRQVEFPKFTGTEAQEWFEHHGVEAPDPREEVTLAEMYATLLQKPGKVEEPARTV